MVLFLVVMDDVKKEYSLRTVWLPSGSFGSLPGGSLAPCLCWVRWVV